MEPTQMITNAQAVAQMNGPQLAALMAQALHFTIFSILGVLLAPAAQATIEHNLAETNVVNKWLPGLKPWLPSLLSAGLAWVAHQFGVDPAAAVAMAASMSAGTHVVNASSLAADATPKVSQ